MTDAEKRPFQILAGEDEYVTEIYKKNGKKVEYGPQQNFSDFYWFCQDEKPKIQAEQPDATVGEIVEEIKKRWENCTFEQKKIYEDIAKEDKERYEDALEDCESEEFTEEEDSDSEENSDSEEDSEEAECESKKCSSEKKNSRRKKQPQGRMSSYAFFVKKVLEENKNVGINFAEFQRECSEKWKKVREEQPNASVGEIAKELDEKPKIEAEQPDATVGETVEEIKKRWERCTFEQKKIYEDLAKKDKERFEKELEDDSDDYTEEEDDLH
ncbi:hypothetical protein RND71_043661 [Anisodus tanguticus]|uniref:HMG box domain-containing protein n=1 Tax=Anisodus tanguticus TaxID=243964 RepID=A0AAE1UTN0_9SOLA|nr:hypothetical protein RND71_043661 [Anisodus tanguticus]